MPILEPRGCRYNRSVASQPSPRAPLPVPKSIQLRLQGGSTSLVSLVKGTVSFWALFPVSIVSVCCQTHQCSGGLLLLGTSCLTSRANVRLVPWDLGECTAPESIQATIGFLNSHINLKCKQCSSLMLIFCQSRRCVIKNDGSGFIINDVCGCGIHLIFFRSWNLSATSMH